MNSDLQNPQPSMTVEEVRGSLDLTDSGAIKNSIRNCLTVFQNDPYLQGAVRYNMLTERIDIVKPLWWSKQTATLNDTDLNYLMLYLEDKYALTSEKKADSMGMTAKRGKEMDSLGMVVKGFKLGCNRAYRRIYGMKKMTGKGLFELGYNDKLLLHEGQLKGWKKYLDDNPRRLMVKRLNPELFTVMQNKVVAGRRCQMVGNCFLLDIPDKMAVIVHRRYSEGDLARLRKEWLACGERGGVLVSAAISIKEKEVLREAMNRGYRIVLLRENGFPRLYKPCGESFDACSEGLLLQISPWEYHMEKKTITREECLELNEIAERIAEGE